MTNEGTEKAWQEFESRKSFGEKEHDAKKAELDKLSNDELYSYMRDREGMLLVMDDGSDIWKENVGMKIAEHNVALEIMTQREIDGYHLELDRKNGLI